MAKTKPRKTAPRKTTPLASKKAKEFRTRLGQVVRDFGGVQTGEDSLSITYTILSPLGPWRIMIYGDWVPTRFACPKTAKKFVDCNPFSGKYNFHLYGPGRESLESFVTRFAKAVTNVLQIQLTTQQRAELTAEFVEYEAQTLAWAAYAAQDRMERARRLDPTQAAEFCRL